MRWWSCIFVAAWSVLLAAPAATAARPDDLFFDAAALALDADLARSQAKWTKAHAQYTNALAILVQLRRDHPEWNPEVVDYRIRTYRQQLDNLDALMHPPIPIEPATAPAPPVAVEATPPEVSPELRAQIIAAEAELAATAQARQKLEDELRHAREETARLAAAKAALQAQIELADLRTMLIELGASLNH